jgi:hypothetical protein
MNIKAFAIQQFARYLTSVSFFQQVKDMVLLFEDSNMPGPQKKEKVLATLRADGVKLGSFLLSLMIELGVAWLKSQSGQLK